MMLVALVGACLCAVWQVDAQGQIDPTDCEILYAEPGIELFCSAGYVAVGACGSGGNRDCDGSNHILKCCRVIGAEDKQLACEGQSQGHGVRYECSSGMQILSLCASGRNLDCGSFSATSVCCDGNGITTGEASYCRWISQEHGGFHECAPSEVVTGYCGSGGNLDCPGIAGGGASSTDILCCSYS